MRKRYCVTLTGEERERLKKLISSGEASAQKITRARILLKADSGAGRPGWDDGAISEALDVGLSTVYRLRKRFVEEGLEAALEQRRPRRVYRRKLDGEGEAHLIALACSRAPEGRDRWTLRLLADRMVELEYVGSLSHETVRRVLKKRSQAMAEEALVHPASGEWGVRLANGGCDRRIQAAIRSEATGGMHG